MKLTQNNIRILGFVNDQETGDCFFKILEFKNKKTESSIKITICFWFKGDFWAKNHVTIKEEVFSKNILIDDAKEITIMNNIKKLKPLVKLLLLLEKHN